jgi:hypothetical protein
MLLVWVAGAISNISLIYTERCGRHEKRSLNMFGCSCFPSSSHVRHSLLSLTTSDIILSSVSGHSIVSPGGPSIAIPRPQFIGLRLMVSWQALQRVRM